MRNREDLKRIASVRKLRQTRERVSARKVAAADAAVRDAERKLRAAEEKVRLLTGDLAERLKQGISPAELALFHTEWLSLRVRRSTAEMDLALTRDRLKAASDEYLSDRIERKKAETWESNTKEAIRDEEDRKTARAVDETIVVRHGW
jgi:flagellar export protein FliJ